jgi:hypothetical protein
MIKWALEQCTGIKVMNDTLVPMRNLAPLSANYARGSAVMQIISMVCNLARYISVDRSIVAQCYAKHQVFVR